MLLLDGPGGRGVGFVAPMDEYVDYGYPDDPAPRWDDDYVWQPIRRTLTTVPKGSRVLDLGCGNGLTAARMRDLGYDVCAVDPSTSGIETARKAHVGVRFEVAEANATLVERVGTFCAVVSVEVIEHCCSPKKFVESARSAMRPNGLLVLTTPYHGYAKNLALAISGRWDAHLNPCWEGGHVKFFSPATITQLLEGAGFAIESIERVGRIPAVAKSMVVTARLRAVKQ